MLIKDGAAWRMAAWLWGEFTSFISVWLFSFSSCCMCDVFASKCFAFRFSLLIILSSLLYIGSCCCLWEWSRTVDDNDGENRLIFPLVYPLTLQFSVPIPSNIYIMNTTHKIKRKTSKK
jgi:hypothetical protein